MYRVDQIKLNINHTDHDLKNELVRLLRVNKDAIDWSSFKILHKSIDARDKKNLLFVYNVAFELSNDSSNYLKETKRLRKYNPIIFNPIKTNVCDDGAKHAELLYKEKLPRPIVVGLGPAGIFASYILALNGLRPIVFERGKSIDDRIKDTDKFFDTMELNEESNVSFGEGGAGAFSDGKLNTNNKDKDGIYHYILDTFVKFGASDKILYEYLPHIGTDKLIGIIKNMRDSILKLGGEIHYNTKWTYNSCSRSKMDEEYSLPTPVILAIGNSARDTFRDLAENGFSIEPKPIAIGYRIAHLQSLINEAQYGKEMCTEESISLLGPATYKLVYNTLSGHSVYSFCMCPGGYIINSSSCDGKLAINGMSYHDRDGLYANSAIVETVDIDDLYGAEEIKDNKIRAIKMIEFQELIEKKAFEIGQGYIPYLTSDNSDINASVMFKGKAQYNANLRDIYKNVGIKFDLNADIDEALTYFNKTIKGFYDNSSKYIIAGPETRTSSPIRLRRDDNCMCNVENYYPCGEGLGHGGGIMSAAADGIRVAIKVVERLNTIYSG